MKYKPEDVEELNSLIDQCMSIPDIKEDKYLTKILEELRQKLMTSKRFKNYLNLRKESAIYSRKHGFQLPDCLNQLLSKVNEVNMGQKDKHHWFQFLHNLD